MEIQQVTSRKIHEKLVGKKMEVLIDQVGAKPQEYIGRTYRDAPDIDGKVTVHSQENLQPGDFVSVHITQTSEYDLEGKVISHS